MSTSEELLTTERTMIASVAEEIQKAIAKLALLSVGSLGDESEYTALLARLGVTGITWADLQKMGLQQAPTAGWNKLVGSALEDVPPVFASLQRVGSADDPQSGAALVVAAGPEPWSLWYGLLRPTVTPLGWRLERPV